MLEGDASLEQTGVQPERAGHLVREAPMRGLAPAGGAAGGGPDPLTAPRTRSAVATARPLRRNERSGRRAARRSAGRRRPSRVLFFITGPRCAGGRRLT